MLKHTKLEHSLHFNTISVNANAYTCDHSKNNWIDLKNQHPILCLKIKLDLNDAIFFSPDWQNKHE